MKPEVKKNYGVMLTPSLAYLARLTARDRFMSLSSFVQQALTDAIRLEDEPSYSEALPVKVPTRYEGLWDADSATRLWLLYTGRPDLMTLAEARLCKLLVGGIEHAGLDVNLKTFCEAYNAPPINKSHLDKDGDA